LLRLVGYFMKLSPGFDSMRLDDVAPSVSAAPLVSFRAS